MNPLAGSFLSAFLFVVSFDLRARVCYHTIGGMTMTTISPDRTIHDLATNVPGFKEAMIELGFDQLANPLQLNTVGRIMSLRKGSRMKDIELSVIRAALAKKGILLEE